MLFSSISFLYYFLPTVFLFYFLVKSKYRNIVLLIFSLLFYFLGDPKYLFVLLGSCLINYHLGKLIEKGRKPKFCLGLAVCYNVLQLLLFKYTDFFIFNINQIFKVKINYLYLVMPVGISFYTFQTLSYVIDIYKKKHKSAKNIIDFMTYVTFFPQLIAGPIVRYSDISSELINRKTDFKTFSLGIKRFVIGLSKKVLLANVLGEFIKELESVTVLSSWLKSFLYTLQIYFDFSGYSDMAIGLGLFFGFHFLENFNYPLFSSSITSFWRKWHISLSMWFRDYVYIPLGGNRVSKYKWIRNVFIVWFLTGFWHGASWNFILWGLYFGFLLVIEKLFLKNFLERTHFFKYIYTIFFVVISFLLFSTDSLKEVFVSFKNMFFLNKIPFTDQETMYDLKNYGILLIIAIFASTPFFKIIIEKIKKTRVKMVIDGIEPIVYLLLFILITAFLIDESFHPFLYFRF